MPHRLDLHSDHEFDIWAALARSVYRNPHTSIRDPMHRQLRPALLAIFDLHTDHDLHIWKAMARSMHRNSYSPALGDSLHRRQQQALPAFLYMHIIHDLYLWSALAGSLHRRTHFTASAPHMHRRRQYTLPSQLDLYTYHAQPDGIRAALAWGLHLRPQCSHWSHSDQLHLLQHARGIVNASSDPGRYILHRRKRHPMPPQLNLHAHNAPAN